MKIVSRPWQPQDLVDDLQMYIDEEPDNYMNGRRTTMCMARDYLKAYFDTGLMPQQIRNAQETLQCFDNIGIKRGNEIVTAEEEGRLMVLPCKVDDHIYLIFAEKEPRKQTKFVVKEYDIDHFTIGGTMIPMITACSEENEWEELIDGTQKGYEYFLTREEAETALKEVKCDG